MASGRNGTLYVGVTSNLEQRVWQHRSGEIRGFASRYCCTSLVHFELFDDMTTAITREKQLKGGPRHRKVTAIEANNPIWRDLADHITPHG
jgi:putative endonuclease